MLSLEEVQSNFIRKTTKFINLNSYAIMCADYISSQTLQRYEGRYIGIICMYLQESQVGTVLHSYFKAETCLVKTLPLEATTSIPYEPLSLWLCGYSIQKFIYTAEIASSYNNFHYEDYLREVRQHQSIFHKYKHEIFKREEIMKYFRISISDLKAIGASTDEVEYRSYTLEGLRRLGWVETAASTSTYWDEIGFIEGNLSD